MTAGVTVGGTKGSDLELTVSPAPLGRRGRTPTVIGAAAIVCWLGSGAAPGAQQPPAPAGATAPKPGGPALSLTGDAGFVIFTVRAEGATDFEAFFAKVREALETGSAPQYLQMAAGWKLFKVSEAPTGQVMYASFMDPAVKGADYDPVKIVADVFPAEANALFSKLKDALISVNRLNLTTTLRMGDCLLASVLPCQKLKLSPPYTR